jgi:hypothetical protein
MGRWAQRRRSGTDTTAAAKATVVSVQKIAGNNLKWTFNVNVTSDGVASPEFIDNNLFSGGIPNATVQNGAKAITCTYPSTPSIGDTWNLTSTPTHVTNPNGSGFVSGTSGTVT